MRTDVLDKVKQLPLDKQQQVVDFINYLINTYTPINRNNFTEKRRLNLGRLKGKIYMKEDFNDTPEDFKDYL